MEQSGIALVEQAEVVAAEDSFAQLNAAQLALVGGGVGETIAV